MSLLGRPTINNVTPKLMLALIVPYYFGNVKLSVSYCMKSLFLLVIPVRYLSHSVQVLVRTRVYRNMFRNGPRCFVSTVRATIWVHCVSMCVIFSTYTTSLFTELTYPTMEVRIRYLNQRANGPKSDSIFHTKWDNFWKNKKIFPLKIEFVNIYLHLNLWYILSCIG